MNKFLLFIAYAFILSGIALIIGLRIVAIDMTEGQAIAEHSPYWLLSIALIVGGGTIIHNVRA